jgi:hypothetical protein
VTSVIGQYPIENQLAKEFYSKAREQIRNAGFDLTLELETQQQK